MIFGLQVCRVMSNFGGFPSLNLGSNQEFLYSLKNSYESARAAITAVIRQVEPKKVWLPWYICGGLSQMLENNGFRLTRYNLSESFFPKITQSIKADEILIYPNYFGLNDPTVKKVLEHFSPTRVIVDNASALYSEPKNCLATVYSPRKFIGIPDGGVVITELPVEVPKLVNPRLLELGAYVYLKEAGFNDQAYQLFREAEKEISISQIYRMSRFSEYYLRVCEEKYTIPKRRQENYDLLETNFRAVNKLKIKRSLDAVPLCYPLLADKDIDRDELIEKGVFVPSYWPEVNRNKLNDFELKIYEKCIFLPCEQRMNSNDIIKMSKVVKKIFGYE